LFAPFRILPGDTVELATVALDGGLALTRGLGTLANTITLNQSGEILGQTGTDLDNSLYRPKAKDIAPLKFLGIEEPAVWLDTHDREVVYLRDALDRAGNAYQQAETLDHPRAGEIAHIGRGIEKLAGALDFYLKNKEDILRLIGKDAPERYIILNQNRDEIRTNGGFPGSVISFTVFRGNIEDFRTDDVYYYDWNLYPFQEVPPPGLALLSDNYGLRDVNYYPDFRDTLEKANTFIEKSGDPTVTVGIALHQGLIENILEDIGPVTLSGVATPFTSENFSLLMSTLVEARYGEETSAKDILRHFVEAFVAQIHEKRAYEEVFKQVERALLEGEILFASRNERIDQFLRQYRQPLPWEVISNTGARQENWIYPLLTSLSGNKSDRILERQYTAETTSIGKCEYMNKITLSHKHLYNSEYEKQALSFLSLIGIREKALVEKMLFIQGKGKNRSFIRLMVPRSATLTGSTAGLTLVDRDYGKEISLTLETPPSATTSKTFRYTLKTPECSGTLPLVSWKRQPGLRNTDMISK
jgi:hypothetical protein